MTSNQNMEFTCTVCGRGFSKKKTLVKHSYIHQSNPKLNCDVCGKQCPSKESLKKHKNVHLNDKKDTHSCKNCKLSFESKSELETHHRDVHLEEKLFDCNTCGAKFSWEENLLKHQRMHLVDNYQCELCSKVFCDTISLRIHQRVHKVNTTTVADLKPFQCTICDKRFQFDFSYKAHIASHSIGLKSKLKAKLDDKDILAKAYEKNFIPASKKPVFNAQVKPYKITTNLSDENNDNRTTANDSKKSTAVNNTKENRKTIRLKKASKKTTTKTPTKQMVYNGRFGALEMTESKPYKCKHCSESFRWEVSLTVHQRKHEPGYSKTAEKNHVKRKFTKLREQYHALKKRKKEDEKSHIMILECSGSEHDDTTPNTSIDEQDAHESESDTVEENKLVISIESEGETGEQCNSPEICVDDKVDSISQVCYTEQLPPNECIVQITPLHKQSADGDFQQHVDNSSNNICSGLTQALDSGKPIYMGQTTSEYASSNPVTQQPLPAFSSLVQKSLKNTLISEQQTFDVLQSSSSEKMLKLLDLPTVYQTSVETGAQGSCLSKVESKNVTLSGSQPVIIELSQNIPPVQNMHQETKYTEQNNSYSANNFTSKPPQLSHKNDSSKITTGKLDLYNKCHLIGQPMQNSATTSENNQQWLPDITPMSYYMPSRGTVNGTVSQSNPLSQNAEAAKSSQVAMVTSLAYTHGNESSAKYCIDQYSNVIGHANMAVLDATVTADKLHTEVQPMSAQANKTTYITTTLAQNHATPFLTKSNTLDIMGSSNLDVQYKQDSGIKTNHVNSNLVNLPMVPAGSLLSQNNVLCQPLQGNIQVVSGLQSSFLPLQNSSVNLQPAMTLVTQNLIGNLPMHNQQISCINELGQIFTVTPLFQIPYNQNQLLPSLGGTMVQNQHMIAQDIMSANTASWSTNISTPPNVNLVNHSFLTQSVEQANALPTQFWPRPSHLS